MTNQARKSISAKRKAAIVRAVRRRRKKVRAMAVAYKGGKCQICGYDRCIESLDFHHIDHRTKSFGISAKGYTRSWKAIREGLEKCIMLCANCHRELHAGAVDEDFIGSLIEKQHSAVAQSVRAADCQEAALIGNDKVKSG